MSGFRADERQRMGMEAMAASDNPGFRPGARQGAFGSGAPVLPGQAARPGEGVRPGAERPQPAPVAAATPTPRGNATEQRTLIVGREIALSGAITSCDRLVVEGSVQANLANCREIDIAESGLFKGSASIDQAEIRGRFEGTLIARKRLHIRSTGKVAASVSNAEIEIEAGGQLSGDIQVLGPDGVAGHPAGAGAAPAASAAASPNGAANSPAGASSSRGTR
jgi:cytoskeletal protein CcmA (bactofilin family)